MIAPDDISGFPPISSPDARVLILGSMPGVRSLEQKEYYAHPQNAFWPIMAELLNFQTSLPYTERLEMLRANHIALWDVLASCQRRGSLDSAITMSTACSNDFGPFLQRHPRLLHLFFNGARPEQIFKRDVLGQLGPDADKLLLQRLPSTSPAYAGMSVKEKISHWHAVLQACKP